MVLIIGFIEDAHARAVAWALERLGITCFILDAIDFPAGLRISISTDKSGREYFVYDHPTQGYTQIYKDEIKAIWRRRLNRRFHDYTGLHPDDVPATISGVRGFMDNLHAFVDCAAGVQVINPAAAAALINNKFVQLTVAKTVGLKVPETLLSNSAMEINRFYTKHGRSIIVKPFSPQSWFEAERRYIQQTILITDKNSDCLHERGLELCPSIFQRYIEKDFDLRITVISEDLYCAKILSQDDPLSKVDCRGGLFIDTKLEPFYALPDLVGSQIREFMHRAGLVFGCIDMIVDREGQYYFLEVNEQGQFLWIEDRCPELRLLCEFTRLFAGSSLIYDEDLSYAAFRQLENKDHISALIEARKRRLEENALRFGDIYRA